LRLSSRGKDLRVGTWTNYISGASRRRNPHRLPSRGFGPDHVSGIRRCAHELILTTALLRVRWSHEPRTESLIAPSFLQSVLLDLIEELSTTDAKKFCCPRAVPVLVLESLGNDPPLGVRQNVAKPERANRAARFDLEELIPRGFVTGRPSVEQVLKLNRVAAVVNQSIAFGRAERGRELLPNLAKRAARNILDVELAPIELGTKHKPTPKPHTSRDRKRSLSGR